MFTLTIYRRKYDTAIVDHRYCLLWKFITLKVDFIYLGAMTLKRTLLTQS